MGALVAGIASEAWALSSHDIAVTLHQLSKTRQLIGSDRLVNNLDAYSNGTMVILAYQRLRLIETGDDRKPVKMIEEFAVWQKMRPCVFADPDQPEGLKMVGKTIRVE